MRSSASSRTSKTMMAAMPMYRLRAPPRLAKKPSFWTRNSFVFYKCRNSKKKTDKPCILASVLLSARWGFENRRPTWRIPGENKVTVFNQITGMRNMRLCTHLLQFLLDLHRLRPLGVHVSGVVTGLHRQGLLRGKNPKLRLTDGFAPPKALRRLCI